MYTVQDYSVIDNNAVYRGYRVTHVCDGCLPGYTCINAVYRVIHVCDGCLPGYTCINAAYRVIHVLTLFTGLYMY